MTFVTAFLIILSFPAITVALFQLMFDRQFGPTSSMQKWGASRSYGSTCFGSLDTRKCTS